MQITNPAVSIGSVNLTDINGNTIQTGDGLSGLGVLRTARAAVDPTANYKTGAGSTAGAVNIVSPATNVNGVILNAGSWISNQSGPAQCTVTTGTAAPTSTITGIILLASFYAGQVLILPVPLYLPAGNGLWEYNGNANAWTRSLSWQVL
jgi:hypothetical protein